MSSNLDKLQKDLAKLIKKANVLSILMQIETSNLEEKQIKKLKDELGEKIDLNFLIEYEAWYSEAYSIIKTLLPHRLDDFSICYKNDKRKETSALTYTLSDYLLGVNAKDGLGREVFGPSAAIPKFLIQVGILEAVNQKFQSTLFDIEEILQADLFDNELEAASELNNKGFYRSAGALAGVVLERHLSQVTIKHSLKPKKKKPTINDFNELLKGNQIIDIPTWRKIQVLADIRNKCDHAGTSEPKKEDIEELIEGIKKIIKLIF